MTHPPSPSSASSPGPEAAGRGDAPAPSGALLAAVAGMQPVTMRKPGRVFAQVALLGATCAGIRILLARGHGDFDGLPPGWVAAVCVTYLSAFLVLLAAALLPRPGQVVPDGKRAGVVALLGIVALTVLPLILSSRALGGPDRPLPALLDRSSWSRWRDCMLVAGSVSLPALAVGTLALRRVIFLNAWRVGAAIGAAAGALAGLTLQLVCPLADPAHLWLAHGLSVALTAGLGAAVFAALGD